VATRRNLDRVEETQDGLTDLRTRVTTWFGDRRDRDKLQQYWTQLDGLKRVLLPSIEQVQGDVHTVRDLTLTGEVHAACRQNDRRVSLIDRYWRYFSDKWDQRDDKETSGTLLAADEVVWSCWATPFQAADAAVAAAPLPYLEPFYTPRAIPRARPPQDFKRADELLRSALATLPVPLVGLPPVVHPRPWWLAAIAHETGHHIQRDLSGGVFYSGIGPVIEAAAVGAGAEPGSWKRWHEEIFADACSVLLLGPAAATATIEMLRTSDASMLAEELAEERAYPSTFVRQRLMDELLSVAGSPSEARVPDFRPDDLDDYNLDPAKEHLRARAKARSNEARRVAAELNSRMAGAPGSLPELCGWEASRYALEGEVQYWRDELLRDDGMDLVPETEPHTARTALAGGVAAWQVIAANDDDGWRAEARGRLAERMRKLLPLCRPPGKRADAESPPLEVREAGNALAGVLFGEAIEADL
jgi:hypothetical protein